MDDSAADLPRFGSVVLATDEPDRLADFYAALLGWHVLDARPKDGWIRIGFDGKRDFCNPAGFVQGGILSAMLDDTMGPAVFTMTDGKLYTATITMTVAPS